MSNRRRPRRQVPLDVRGAIRKPDKLSDPLVVPNEECPCGCGRADFAALEGGDPFDFLESTPADDMRLMKECLKAEAQGDPHTALDLYGQTRHMVDAPHERVLRELIELGDSAPSWVFNRWVVRQSYLWLLFNGDPRTETAVCMTLASCFEVDEDIDLALLRGLSALVPAHQVCAELATHALGGLGDFVDLAAGKPLLARCSMLRAWADASLRPLRYEEKDCGDILVSDLVSGGQRRVLDLGAMSGADTGQHVLGRLVPIDQAPGLMFEERPLRIDEETARNAAALGPGCTGSDAPLPGWMCALSEGVDAGRLTSGVFALAGGTPLGSDVPYEYGKRMPAA